MLSCLSCSSFLLNIRRWLQRSQLWNDSQSIRKLKKLWGRKLEVQQKKNEFIDQWILVFLLEIDKIQIWTKIIKHICIQQLQSNPSCLIDNTHFDIDVKEAINFNFMKNGTIIPKITSLKTLSSILKLMKKDQLKF